MLKNQFVAIIQNLHFRDNTTFDPTCKFGKVNPLLNMVCDILGKHAKLTKCPNIDDPILWKNWPNSKTECHDLDTKSGVSIFREGISMILKYIKAKDPRMSFLTNLLKVFSNKFGLILV